MAGISPDHVEIRDALRDDLAAVVKPIVKALRSGDMNALSLVRLAGEGKVIKNRGRAVASVEDVTALVEKNVPKQETYTRTDVKEFYKNVPYTREDVKKALKITEGEDRLLLESQLLRDVAIDAGVSEKEVNAAHAKVHPTKSKLIAEDVVGLHHKPAVQLKKGLATREIEKLNEGYKKITQQGVEAMHTLKSGPTNPHGIEQLVLEDAIPHIIQGDKHYLGALAEEGRAQLAKMSNGDTDEDSDMPVKGHHTKRHQARHESHPDFNEID
jgi:hypothetical protein